MPKSTECKRGLQNAESTRSARLLPVWDRPLARMSARPGNRSLTIPDQTLGGGSWRATMEPVICTVLILLLSGAACFSEEVVWWSRRNQHSWITWLALILAY